MWHFTPGHWAQNIRYLFSPSSTRQLHCWLSKRCICISLRASYNFWSAHCDLCRWLRYCVIHYWSARVLCFNAAGPRITKERGAGGTWHHKVNHPFSPGRESLSTHCETEEWSGELMRHDLSFKAGVGLYCTLKLKGAPFIHWVHT